MKHLIPLAVLSVAAVLPAAAQADSYQASDPASLNNAFSQAAAHPGADTVHLAAGTYVGHFGYYANDPLTLTGAGTGKTVLRATGAEPALTLSGSGAATTSVSDLTVDLPALADGGVILRGIALTDATAHDVEVTSPSTQTASGVVLAKNSALRDSTVSVKAGHGVETVAPDGPRTVAGTTIDASIGASAHSGNLTIRDSEIRARFVGIESAVATTDAHNSLIRVTGSPSVVEFGVYQFAAPGMFTGDHLTIVGGPNSDIGVLANASNAGTSSASLRNSVIAGAWQTSFRRDAAGGGTATINAGYSAFDAPAAALVGAGAGPGSFNENPAGSNVKDQDPRFVKPVSSLPGLTLDYRLRGNSPLVDHADPSDVTTTDLRGKPKVGARRDIGSHEYQRTAPVAMADAPAQAGLGEQVAFSGAGSSDADGDPLTYEWSFGDGTTATGSSASHAYAAAGTYTATLTVTDVTGLSDTATAEVTVPAIATPDAPPASPEPPTLPSGGPTPGRDVAAPLVTQAKLARRNFHSHGRKAGTTLNFRLSEAGSVQVTVDKLGTKGRYGPARYLPAVQRPAGARNVKITGRVNGKPLRKGRYRLRVVATDAAGNRSAAVAIGFRIV